MFLKIKQKKTMNISEVRRSIAEKYSESVEKYGTSADFDYLLDDIMTLDKIMYREFGMKFNFDNKEYERR